MIYNTTTLENNSAHENVTSSVNGPQIYDFIPLADWFRYFEYVFISLVLVVGIPGNALVIKIIHQNEDRSTTDLLVLVLAVTDLFSLSVNSILLLCSIDTKLELEGEIIVLCKMRFFLFSWCFYFSQFLLCLLSLDRYNKTFWTKAFNLTTHSIKKFAIVCALVATILSVPYFVNSNTNSEFVCLPHKENRIIHDLAVFPRLILTFVFTCVVIFVYGKIYFALRRQMQVLSRDREMGIVGEGRTNISSSSQRCAKRLWKISKLVLCITLLHVVSSILPVIFPAILMGLMKIKTNAVITLVFNFHFLGDFSNPICFILLSSRFRSEFKENMKLKIITSFLRRFIL